jgi:hypothetical protein
MESPLHLGAHAMSRGGKSPSQSEGRYHSADFRDAAKVLGLDAERVPIKGFGFGEVSMSRGTKTRYRSEIAKLDRALARWEAVPIRAKSRAPIPLVCECTPETILAGLAKRGLPPDTGLGKHGTKGIAAPKRIIAPTGVAPEAASGATTAALSSSQPSRAGDTQPPVIRLAASSCS